MKKIVLPALLFTFLFIGNVAHADVAYDYIEGGTDSDIAEAFRLLNTNAKCSAYTTFNVSHPLTTLASTTAHVRKFGSPTGTLYASLYSLTNWTTNSATITFIATSTSNIDIASLPTSGTATQTWNFGQLLNATGTYAIKFTAEPCTINASQYIQFRWAYTKYRKNSAWGYGGTETLPNSAEFTGYVTGHSILLEYDEEPVVEGDSCNMASTTEAVYTVGQSIQLYLGLFLFLIFLWIGFTFMKRYI